LHISQHLSIPSFILPPSIELSEVLRGLTSGRTDRVDIHDCLFSSTFEAVRKERTVEPSSRVILPSPFLCLDTSPPPLSSSFSSPRTLSSILTCNFKSRSLWLSVHCLYRREHQEHRPRDCFYKRVFSHSATLLPSSTTFTNLRHHTPFGTVSTIFGQGYLLSSLSHLPTSIFQHQLILPSTHTTSMHTMPPPQSVDMVRRDSGNPIEDRKIFQSVAASAQFTPSSKVCLLFFVHHLRATFQSFPSSSSSPSRFSVLSARTRDFPFLPHILRASTYIRLLQDFESRPPLVLLRELFVSVCFVFAFWLCFLALPICLIFGPYTRFILLHTYLGPTNIPPISYPSSSYTTINLFYLHLTSSYLISSHPFFVSRFFFLPFSYHTSLISYHFHLITWCIVDHN
jgi:hypothetical protein